MLGDPFFIGVGAILHCFLMGSIFANHVKLQMGCQHLVNALGDSKNIFIWLCLVFYWIVANYVASLYVVLAVF